MKIKDRIAGLRRTFPLIDPRLARFLHAKAADAKKKGKKIVLYTVLWSDDGRVSLHRTTFVKHQAMSAQEWAGWLQVNTPRIMANSVLAYVNRAFGSTWNIDRVFGWHFDSSRAAK